MNATNGIATGMKLAALAVCLSFLFSGALSMVGTDLGLDDAGDNAPVQGAYPDEITDTENGDDESEYPAGWGHSARGNDIFVPGSYWTISDAVAAASPGDSIWVNENFTGNPYNEMVVVDKTLNITGIDPQVVFMSGQIGYCFNISAPNVNISGFGFEEVDYCVQVWDTHDVNVFGMYMYPITVGVLINTSYDIRVNDTYMNDMIIGVLASDSTGVEVWDCEFFNMDDGVLFENTTSSVVANCTFGGSTAGVHLADGADDCEVYWSHFEEANYHVYAEHSDGASIHNNTFYASEYGIYLVRAMGTAIDRNTFSSHDYGIGTWNWCNGTTITHNVISDASSGIYLMETNDTLISGGDGWDNWTRIFDCGIGLWIEDSGNLTINGYVASYDNSNHGLYAHDSDNITITDSIFQENGDKGVYFYEHVAHSQITGSLILNNTYGLYIDTCQFLTVDGNAIVGNTYRGIKMKEDSNNVTISDCYVCGNDNGIRIASSMHNTVENCTIVNENLNAEDLLHLYPSNANTWKYNLYGDYMEMDADWDYIGDTPFNVSWDSGFNHTVWDSNPRTRVEVGTDPTRASPTVAPATFAVIQAAADYTLPEDDLEVWYAMDEDYWSGVAGEVVDSSGNGHDGVRVGGANTTDWPVKIGRSGEFNGSSDYVQIPDDDSLDLIDDFTLEAWIRVNEFSYLGGIISKYQSTESKGLTLRLGVDAPYNKINMNNVESASTLALNTWYHVAVTVDSGTVHIYINGSHDSSGASGHTMQANSDPLCIGVDYQTSPRYFNGTIDEVRIYNRVLAPAEIEAHAHTAYGAEQTITIPGSDPVWDSINEYRDGWQPVQVDGYYFEDVEVINRGRLDFMGDKAGKDYREPWISARAWGDKVFDVEGYDILFDGLHVTGLRHYSSVNTGMYIFDSDTIDITDCQMDRTTGTGGYPGGIVALGTMHMDVDGCRVTGNRGYGIVLSEGDWSSVTNTQVLWNGMEDSGPGRPAFESFSGLYMVEAGNNTFYNDEFSYNGRHGFKAEEYCNDNTIDLCTANDNGLAGGGPFRGTRGSGGDGFTFYDNCWRNTITYCTANYNENGFELGWGSHHSTIDHSEASHNYDSGIVVDTSIVPSVTFNTLHYNNNVGIDYQFDIGPFRGPGGNMIYMYQFPVPVDISNNDVLMYGDEESSGIMVANVGSQRTLNGDGMWYSGTGPAYQGSMERILDLTNYTDPKLGFWHFYDLADTRDFIFVNVSDDVGEDNRYYEWNLYMEEGWKVSSEWTYTVLDLSPWAGQKIWLRFQYVTDLFDEPDWWFGGGWWLDDIEVFDTVAVQKHSDDMETVGDWGPQGSGGTRGANDEPVAMMATSGGDTRWAPYPQIRELEEQGWSTPWTLDDEYGVRWIETATHPATRQACVVTLQEGGERDGRTYDWARLVAYVYDGEEWDSGTTISWGVFDLYERCFNVEFESQSGDILIVYSDMDYSYKPRYVTYSDGSWSSSQELPNLGWESYYIYWIEMDSDPNSDRIGMAAMAGGTRTAGYPVTGYVWSGSSWYSMDNGVEYNVAIDSYSSKPFDICFESLSGDLHIYVGTYYEWGDRRASGDTEIFVKQYDWDESGGEWDEAGVVWSDWYWGWEDWDIYWVEADRAAQTDEIIVASYDRYMSGPRAPTGYYVRVNHWTGSAWDDYDVYQIASPDTSTGWFDVEFEQRSGVGHVFMASQYTSRDGGYYRNLLDWAYTGGEWQDPTYVGTTYEINRGGTRESYPSIKWVDAECVPGGDTIVVGALNEYYDLHSWITSYGEEPEELETVYDEFWYWGEKSFDIFWLGGYDLGEPWDHGTPTSAGPLGHGSNLWGTELDGQYAQSTTYSLMSPRYPVEDGGFGGRVEFDHWLDVEDDLGDGGIVEVRSNGQGWTKLDRNNNEGNYDGIIAGDGMLAGQYGFCEDSASGRSPLATPETVSFFIQGHFLTDWVQFRFTLATDSDNDTGDGWYIDDLVVYVYEKNPAKVLFTDGAETPDPFWNVTGPRWATVGKSLIMSGNTISGGIIGIYEQSCGETQLNDNTINNSFLFPLLIDQNMDFFDTWMMMFGEFRQDRGEPWGWESPVFEFELEMVGNDISDNEMDLDYLFSFMMEGTRDMEDLIIPFAQANIYILTGFDSYLDIRDNTFMENTFANLQIWQALGDTNIEAFTGNTFYNYSGDTLEMYEDFMRRSEMQGFLTQIFQWMLEPGFSVINGLAEGGLFRDGYTEQWAGNITFGDIADNTFENGAMGMLVMADGNVSADSIEYNIFRHLHMEGQGFWFRGEYQEPEEIGLTALNMGSNMNGVMCPRVTKNIVEYTGGGLSFRSPPEGHTDISIFENEIRYGIYIPPWPGFPFMAGISHITSVTNEMGGGMEPRSGAFPEADIIRVNIYNNTVEGHWNGIMLTPSIFAYFEGYNPDANYDVTIENNNVTGNYELGISVGSGSEMMLRSRDVWMPYMYGLFCSGTGDFSVTGNTATGNHYGGIAVGVRDADSIDISDNIATDNEGTGISLNMYPYGNSRNSPAYTPPGDSYTALVSGNTINNNRAGWYSNIPTGGLHLYNCEDVLVTGNVIVQNNGSNIGIENSDYIRVDGNDVSRATASDRTSDRRLDGDDFNGHTGAGVTVRNSYEVVINFTDASLCTGAGVIVDDSWHVYVLNSTIEGNGDYGILTGNSWLWVAGDPDEGDFTQTISNNGHGIYSEYGYFFHLTDCEINNNDGDGVYVTMFYGMGGRDEGRDYSPSLFIADNDANNNGGSGIYIDHPYYEWIYTRIVNNNVQNNGEWGLYVNDPDQYIWLEMYYNDDPGGMTFYSIATGDLDGDGDLDIVTGDSYDYLYIWENDGTPWSGDNWEYHYIGDADGSIYGLGVGDLDGDGDLDIVAGDDNDYVCIFRNDGTPFNDEWDYYEIGEADGEILSLALGDLDGDGDLDIVTGDDNDYVYGFRNDGNIWKDDYWDDWEFGYAEGDVYCLALGDLDNDGDLDIVTGDDDYELWGFRNDGTPWGDWDSYYFGYANDYILSLDLGDLDNDGWLDIVTGDEDNTVLAWPNDGSPWGEWDQNEVSDNLDEYVYGVVIADFDRDGWPDIAACDDDSYVWVFDNDRTPFSGNWDDEDYYSTYNMYAICAGDFDGDGWVDVATGASSGKMQTWRAHLDYDVMYYGEWAIETSSSVLNNPVYTGTLPINVMDGGTLVCNGAEVYMFWETPLNVMDGGSLMAYDTTFTSYTQMPVGRALAPEDGLPWNFSVEGNLTLSDCVVAWPNSVYCNGAELVSITGTDIYFTAFDVMTITGCSDVSIEFSNLHHPAGSHGLKAQDSVIYIGSSQIFNCTDGINARDSSLTVVDSAIFFNERHGVSLYQGGAQSFEGCAIYSNGKDGVNAKLVEDLALYDNLIYNNTRNGVFLSGCGIIGEDGGGGNELGDPGEKPVHMEGNAIYGNDDGVTATHGTAVRLLNEYVYDNGDGLNVLDASDADVDDSAMDNGVLDFYVTDASFCRATNTTHDEDKVTVQDTGYYGSATQIIVEWYIDFRVYDSGTPFAGANVSVLSPNGDYRTVPGFMHTDSKGATDRFLCVGYMRDIYLKDTTMNPQNVTVQIISYEEGYVTKYRDVYADSTKTVVIGINLNPASVGNIKKVFMDEDSMVNGVFDVDDYFFDSEPLTYKVEGTTNLDVTIGPDGMVNITAATPNWNGPESFYIRATDSINQWAVQTVKVVVAPVNDPPFVENVTISPAKPRTTSALDAQYDWHDPDQGSGGEVNQSLPGAPWIMWYCDDVHIPAQDDKLKIPSSATNKGEVWHYTIVPTDLMGLNGTMVTSENTTIRNSAPSMGWPELWPDDVYTDTDVIVRPSGWSDPDGDAEGYQYQWQLNINGIWEDVEGETTSMLSSDLFFRPYEIRCFVTPFDGEKSGEGRYTNATEVKNSLPVIDRVIITTPGQGVGPYGDSVTKANVLTATVEGFHDADGDPAVRLHYQWYKQDGPIAGATRASLNLRGYQVGDTFTCDVTPDDGYDLGDTVESNTVTIINNKPRLYSVSLLPEAPSEYDAILPLPQGYTDEDGDEAGPPRFTWYIDSAPISFTGSYLPANYTSVGQSVFVVVEPYDGRDYGPGVASPTVFITSPVEDTDGDGIPDSEDQDIDGDGFLNEQDAFPYDDEEYSDLDHDGIGDASDEDIDGDGVPNEDDDFPRDPGEYSDMDKDGIGDNSDSDIDGDGIPNEDDPEPYKSSSDRAGQYDSALSWVELFLLLIILILILLMVRSYMRTRRLQQKGDTANCSVCGSEMPMDATTCPGCGAEFDDDDWGDDTGDPDQDGGEEEAGDSAEVEEED